VIIFELVSKLERKIRLTEIQITACFMPALQRVASSLRYASASSSCQSKLHAFPWIKPVLASGQGSGLSFALQGNKLQQSLAKPPCHDKCTCPPFCYFGKLCLWEDLKYRRDEPCTDCKKKGKDVEESERF